MKTSDPRGPAGGWFSGKSFVLPVRVYYEDTDFSGVVYHASYLRFMERGRSEFLRSSGLRHQDMLEAGQPLVWAVRRIAIDYGKVARVDEALEVVTGVADLTGARMRLAQSVRRGTDQLCRAEVEVCVMTLEGKPRRIPGRIRDKLSEFLQG